MKHLNTLWTCLSICGLGYWLLPIGMQWNTGFMILMLLFVFPLMTVAVSAYWAKTCRFMWWFSWLLVLLFLPTVWVYYNESALVYVWIYLGLSYGGQGIGKALQGKR